jgi:ATP-dependent RNA helicase RhlE
MGGKVGNNAARALILVPTRELAEQVHESVRTYAEGLPLRSMVAYGGVSINPQMMTLRKGVDVLVATPGRLLDLHRQNAVHFNEVKTLVLDEADRMLDLGFARELDNILKLLPKKRQTLLFSATFSDPIRALSNQMLREPVRIEATPRNTTVAAIRGAIGPRCWPSPVPARGSMNWSGCWNPKASRSTRSTATSRSRRACARSIVSRRARCAC